MDTLVINADGLPVSLLPISAVSWKEAILYMYHDKCDVLEWYDDWVVHSAAWETHVPAVIMLKNYLRRSNSVRFSKGNIFLRDTYHCLYCGTSVNNTTATMDHVLPLSKGGKTTWENIATACSPCNTRKEDKLHMKPMYQPYKPGYYELVRKRKQLPFQLRHDSWARWLGLEDEIGKTQ
jgi:5-methylcytosine-specific restriction endonuclease McrA